ncbi:hypothetical protein PVAND_011203 [Polypedilum vanderplanki]|uniref:Activating signal cointegrator 1 complex subunit 3 n=1 Tax=Polypedilum vanderplanki TaxID=319348 RepID=A0A9J6CJ85_POLVA|nr:hypothetical protein PVAND_011203 [Polypedilum vanderplanki]
MSLAKLSRSARASTDLDIKRNFKKIKNQQEQSHEKSSWQKAKKFILNNCDQQLKGTIEKKLHELWTKIKDTTNGEESSDLIDDLTLFVFSIFLNQKNVLTKHQAQLKKFFGEINSKQTHDFHSLVAQIAENLSDQNLEKLKEIVADNDSNSNQKLFGSTIKYTAPTEYFQDTSFLNELITTTQSFTANGTVSSFSMKFEKTEPETSKTHGTTYDRNWMSKNINSDLVEPLIIILKSQKSNDELQNELFELLGFDKFEMILEILDNRKVLLKNLDANEKKEMVKEHINKRQTEALKKPTPAPDFLMPVLVQSEKEKELVKLARKDEKKLRNMKATGDDEDDEEAQLAALQFNQTSALLKIAQKAPLMSENNSSSIFQRYSLQSQPKYPNVYDSTKDARAHIGFLSGNKILLPEDTVRKDSKMYEEVTIPAKEVPSNLTVGNNRVKIESLDEIGQIVFKGTKELNRIQTIVIPTAYHSNENLLICAPTGAGKTNIAMLTMINVIRAHTDQGVIHREQFKIVYVAPMKALAAEMTENFSKRLKPLGIAVRELTGDMQLTKTEMQATQILVTTPEKWDVVTRKGAGDASMISLVKLLIIDEVHLLHGERGPVVEALVARTLRLVESSQSMIRIVGLSATLPNYIDVARFLRVNPAIGLFFFDSRFRPIPLSQQFIGIKSLKALEVLNDMNTVCYEKCLEQLKNGKQVMVFVHARNATTRTAMNLLEMAQQKGHTQIFSCEKSFEFSNALKTVSKSRNKQLKDLFQGGFGFHHAGMLRQDRTMVEKLFSDGLIKVLVCTATLAWGVNLPAHAVIIKGTEIYDSKHGSFVDLGILDVLQIFGRAGRPQFDKSGLGIIITTHDKLNHYLSLLTNQFPIESNFVQCLADNLNAEISLGTISNIQEAIEWLSYTYLFVRMRINPQVYGLNYTDIQEDPTLVMQRRKLIHDAAMALDKAKMIRYNIRTEDLNITDLGRTASHFYIKYDTVEIFNEMLRPIMNESEILNMMANAHEFQQLKVRDDEMDELDDLNREVCEVPVKGGSENLHGKVNILMQTYLSRGFVKSFSLVSDMSYINQNAVRIARGLFQIILRNNNAILAGRLLTISKMFERQMWDFMTPLRQFSSIPFDVIEKIENRGLSIEALREMTAKEISDMVRNHKYGEMVKRYAHEFPMLSIEANLQPITRTVLRIRIFITADFKWNDRIHGKNSESFWIWIEDPENNYIYHSEYFQVTKKQVINNEQQELIMTIPLKDPLPPQYYIRATSDSWLSSSVYEALSFKHLILPEMHPPHTELLPLQPLPITVLKEPSFEALYKFTHFNPIQTQIFHCLYHTDHNVLLGAPTGSGKSIAAEIAIFRVFKQNPKAKVIYIAPLKALVKERIDDWSIRFGEKLGKIVVELTGDVTPDANAIRNSHVIVTTPEKWDGISRSWQTREYVRDVSLIVIDEIHLLGEDRGPVLEVIVSRTNFISSHTTRKIRIIGLSTALANAKDLANWLEIGEMGLYNFKPSVRPVPMSVHISGFPGKHYCPRMATMNRPAFQAIRQYSPCTPALIFVSSRRQTRLTALDLIAFLAGEENPKQFLHIQEDEMDQILMGIKDNNLKLTLAFGIGLHHAGLQEKDRKVCEELFLNRKIQILIATSTLAWGVNLPAHLVIIKGTEYYDKKTNRYVDMPITDVLQMMGRAGRPQYDNEGIACVFVHDVKKNFYKKFLYDPFPVESSLLAVLPDHINAEIVAGTVQTKQGILDYLTWTYFFRRLLKNPSYYNMEATDDKSVNRFLSELIQNVLETLQDAGCIEFDDDNRTVYSTSMGRISSYYYLSHITMKHFANTLDFTSSDENVLRIMCDSYEFVEQPVRHNEEKYNEELAKMCRLKCDPLTYDNPHTKTFLLMQAHFSHLPLPNTDFATDTKSVLDQSIRILQAMIDVVAENGWLATTLKIQLLIQSVIQARWQDDPVVLCLPHVDEHNLYVFNNIKIDYPILTLPLLKEKCLKNYEALAGPLRKEFEEPQIEQIYKVIKELPTVNVELKICGPLKDCIEVEQLVKQPLDRNSWIQIHADEEYSVAINLHRLGVRNSNYIYCRFPKPKDEGWFLTLGHQENGELLALKRTSPKTNRSSHHLIFNAPSSLGRVIYTVYIVSDGYIGFDQQYNIQLEVIEPLKDKMRMFAGNYSKEI